MKKTTRGFTLLEVMIAVAVLGIAMVAIHHGQAQGIRAQARTQEITLATLKGMELVTEKAFINRSELPRSGESEEGTFDEPYDYMHWSLRVEDNEFVPERIQDVYVTISWGHADPKKVTEEASAHPGEGGRAQRLELCLYVAKLI